MRNITPTAYPPRFPSHCSCKQPLLYNSTIFIFQFLHANVLLFLPFLHKKAYYIYSILSFKILTKYYGYPFMSAHVVCFCSLWRLASIPGVDALSHTFSQSVIASHLGSFWLILSTSNATVENHIPKPVCVCVKANLLNGFPEQDFWAEG